jgi:hypothetical protein
VECRAFHTRDDRGYYETQNETISYGLRTPVVRYASDESG